MTDVDSSSRAGMTTKVNGLIEDDITMLKLYSGDEEKHKYV
jgi:hypothetical protein